MVINQNKDYICSETLVTQIEFVDEVIGGTKIEIDELVTEITISKT